MKKRKEVGIFIIFFFHIIAFFFLFLLFFFCSAVLLFSSLLCLLLFFLWCCCCSLGDEEKWGRHQHLPPYHCLFLFCFLSSILFIYFYSFSDKFSWFWLFFRRWRGKDFGFVCCLPSLMNDMNNDCIFSLMSVYYYIIRMSISHCLEIIFHLITKWKINSRHSEIDILRQEGWPWEEEGGRPPLRPKSYATITATELSKTLQKTLFCYEYVKMSNSATSRVLHKNYAKNSFEKEFVFSQWR